MLLFSLNDSNFHISFSGFLAIRQLINAQVIRRNTIAALSTPVGRRNFLAVSQEKAKLTILQLGALFCGPEANKKKLSLPRLATLPHISFTALTMATNPIRDDVLAICGLKDCQVIVIGTAGAIVSHLTVKAQLDSQNHIIKPIWVPGSQTELALTTSDGVKVYDLAKDTDEPIFHFLLPSGKVRDATFVIQVNNRTEYLHLSKKSLLFLDYLIVKKIVIF